MTAGKSNPVIEAYIETYTGKKFWFLDPTPEMISIEDIAHALSMQCRYTGHVKKFYSVAEHCVHVSYLAKDKLQGLMHDASEAYIVDIASPIKPHLQNYKKLEHRIMQTVAETYGFDWPESDDTKDADKAQLKTEARHLLLSGGKDWLDHFPTQRRRGVVPQCWNPSIAEEEFLSVFYELMDQREVENRVPLRAA